MVRSAAVYVQMNTPEAGGLFAVGQLAVIGLWAVATQEATHHDGRDTHSGTLIVSVSEREIQHISHFMDVTYARAPWFEGRTQHEACQKALRAGQAVARNLAAVIESSRRNPDSDAWVISWSPNHNNWHAEPLEVQST